MRYTWHIGLSNLLKPLKNLWQSHFQPIPKRLGHPVYSSTSTYQIHAPQHATRQQESLRGDFDMHTCMIVLWMHYWELGCEILCLSQWHINQASTTFEHGFCVADIEPEVATHDNKHVNTRRGKPMREQQRHQAQKSNCTHGTWVCTHMTTSRAMTQLQRKICDTYWESLAYSNTTHYTDIIT